MRDMEVPPGSNLHMASGDVDACFFQYKMPPGLRYLFGLPGIKKRYLRADWRDHPMFAGYGLDDSIFLRLIIVPMGWSWSVFFIQMGQSAVLSEIDVDGPWLLNGTSALQVGDGSDGGKPVKSLYIDNFACFSTDRSLAFDC